MAYNEKEREPLRIPEPVAEKARLHKGIIGQEEAVDAFARLVVKIRSGIRPLSSAPIDAKFLAGPSGVGKTALVYQLAEVLAETNPVDAKTRVLRIDGANYQTDYQIAKILGSPPGYIGSKDPRDPDKCIDPLLSRANLDKHSLFYKDNKGQQKKLTLILVDEVEKAHTVLEKAFLAVLQEGQLQLGDNSVTSFKDTVIFFTSNIGSWGVEKLQSEPIRPQDKFPKPFVETAAEALMRDDSREIYAEAFHRRFMPEFRGRINELIIFHHLSREELEQIAVIKLKAMEQEFRASGIDIRLKTLPRAVSWLAEHGYNLSEGVRALGKVIDESIRNPLIAASPSIHKQVVEIGIDEISRKPNFFLLSDSREVGILEQDIVAMSAASNPEKPDVLQISDKIKERLLQQLKECGLIGYYRCRDSYVQRGKLTAEAANALPEVRKLLALQLITIGRHDGEDGFRRYRDAIVYNGIGTTEDWDALLQVI